MKSTVWTVLLVGLIVGALVRLVWYYAGQPEPGEPIAHYMPAACAACGKAYADTIGKQPARCRFCGEQAVWRAAQCREKNCGAVFPIVRDVAGPGPADLGRCPKCGSRRTGEVKPDAVSEP